MPATHPLLKDVFDPPKAYISPLEMNGMHGRVLDMPSPTGDDHTILTLYGHHASIERIFGLTQNLNDYGRVIMPDLPGFGGMDSLYSIGESGTLDDYAHYLAKFIDSYLPEEKFAIAAMSFGFLVATRMLQLYPEIAARVDLLISFVGFSKYNDFKFSPRRLNNYRLLMRFASRKIPAWTVKHTILAPSILRFWYPRVNRHSAKLHDATGPELQRRLEYEMILWQINDVRTHLGTYLLMFTADLTSTTLPLELLHVETPNDQYFDNHQVRDNLQRIFSQVIISTAGLQNHAPSIISDKAEARDMLPDSVHDILAKRSAKGVS